TSSLERQLESANLDLQLVTSKLLSGDEGGIQSVLDAQFSLAGARLSLESNQSSSPWIGLETARLGLERAQNAIADAQRAYDDAVSRPETPASAVDSAYQRLRDAEIGLREAQNSYYSAAQAFNTHLIGVKQQENAVLQQEIAMQQAIQ